VLEPQKAGLDQLGELPTASTLCGACGEVCPVQIPLPKLLNRLRYDSVRRDGGSKTLGAGRRRKMVEALTWRLWAIGHSHPLLYQIGTRLLGRLGHLMPKRLGAWTRVRQAPVLATRSLHQLAREEGFSDE
ncbi:MAG: lactate utilization protein LutB domain-containing protein, partial [Sedimenticola sp.]